MKLIQVGSSAMMLIAYNRHLTALGIPEEYATIDTGDGAAIEAAEKNDDIVLIDNALKPPQRAALSTTTANVRSMNNFIAGNGSAPVIAHLPD